MKTMYRILLKTELDFQNCFTSLKSEVINTFVDGKCTLFEIEEFHFKLSRDNVNCFLKAIEIPYNDHLAKDYCYSIDFLVPELTQETVGFAWEVLLASHYVNPFDVWYYTDKDEIKNHAKLLEYQLVSGEIGFILNAEEFTNYSGLNSD